MILSLEAESIQCLQLNRDGRSSGWHVLLISVLLAPPAMHNFLLRCHTSSFKKWVKYHNFYETFTDQYGKDCASFNPPEYSACKSFMTFIFPCLFPFSYIVSFPYEMINPSRARIMSSSFYLSHHRADTIKVICLIESLSSRLKSWFRTSFKMRWASSVYFTCTHFPTITIPMKRGKEVKKKKKWLPCK